MTSAISRNAFDPRQHRAALLQQQGRVASDADWNEFAQLLLHRLSVQTIDTIGDCGVPKHHAGLGLSINGTDLTISPGRFYAGGMLVELEKATSFAAQPDWPFPPQDTWNTIAATIGNTLGAWPGFAMAGEGAATLRTLVYVEVWLRHITALEDEAARTAAQAGAAPDWSVPPLVGCLIRERALGGPDTCTQLQTVAQVKLWPAPGDATDCTTACAALDAALPPATAGLLQLTVPPTPVPVDPCQEPLEGGYGGAENRMYRVEIHDGGAAGVATYKWSDENGAFAVGVDAPAYTTIAPGAQLIITSDGDDQQTALANGQFVELCGTDTSLGLWRNKIAKLTADPLRQPDGTWAVTLDTAVVVPTAPFLRRWSSGALTVQIGKALPLGDDSAIQLTFSADASGDPPFFHAGDYWTWSARTITRDIEPQHLTQMPQAAEGIERHYCCLGLVSWSRDANGNITADAPIDCRTPFPPLTELPQAEGGCCCTVSVGPDAEDAQYTDIAAAVAAVGAGGVVCIQAGKYQIDKPVPVHDNIEIRGCGDRTVIVTRDGAFQVLGNHVIIRDLELRTMSRAPGIISGTERPVQDLLIANLHVLPADVTPITPYGLALGAQGMVVEDSWFELTGVQITPGSTDVLIRRNRFTGTAKNRALADAIHLGASELDKPSAQAQSIADVTIEDNVIDEFHGAGIASLDPVRPDGKPVQTGYQLIDTISIRRNVLTGCDLRPQKLNDMTPAMSRAAVFLPFAIHADISENRIESNGAMVPACGISILIGAGVRIRANEIRHNGAGDAPENMLARAAVQLSFALPGELGGAQLASADTALAVFDNTIVSDDAPVLIATGVGAFSIDRNTLTTIGIVSDARLGALVRVTDIGVSDYAALIQAVAGVTTAQTIGAATPDALWPVGADVSFTNNECLLDVQVQPDRLPASIFIWSNGDCLASGNRQRVFTGVTLAGAAPRLVTQATLIAGTLRVTGNQYFEDSATFSWVGYAGIGSATGNTSANCYRLTSVLGSVPSANVADIANLIAPAKRNYCGDLSQFLDASNI